MKMMVKKKEHNNFTERLSEILILNEYTFRYTSPMSMSIEGRGEILFDYNSYKKALVTVEDFFQQLMLYGISNVDSNRAEFLKLYKVLKTSLDRKYKIKKILEDIDD